MQPVSRSAEFSRFVSDEEHEMDDRSIGVFVKNMAVLLLLALPVSVIAMMAYHAWVARNTAPWPASDLLLVYATALLPVALGGGIHHWLLWFLRNRFRYQRLLAIITSPIAGAVLLGAVLSRAFIQENVWPIALGWMVYAALVRPFRVRINEA